MAVLVKFVEPELMKAVGDALGLANIMEVTIRSRWDDLVTIEVKVPMEKDLERKVAETIRRYTLVPLDSGEQSPAPTADTLTPAPFDPTP
jgi:hypothetical protein